MFARELHILNFHADLAVLPDSTLDVTETIRVEFSGSWQGLFRTIPVEYDGPGGFNYSLFLSDVRATEANADRRAAAHREAAPGREPRIQDLRAERRATRRA